MSGELRCADCGTVVLVVHGSIDAQTRHNRPHEIVLTTSTDLGSEYGRLLAERDRLIAEGVDPDDLDVPLEPTP